MATTLNPLVSIGLPTYNRPQQLCRALASITAQTYPHFEVIVSDNCSPGPETQAVAEQFMAADSRIRYIRQPRNIGMFHNFKFVFDQSHGQYFAWLADDDVRSERFLEKCMSIFAAPESSSKVLLVNTYSQLLPASLCPSSFQSAIAQSQPSVRIDDQTADPNDQQSELPEVLPEAPRMDQGCITVGLSAAERYHKYLSSIYSAQGAIGDLIHGVMKRDAVQQAFTHQKNVLGWDRLFLSSLALAGEFYTIPEVLMYSSPGGMSHLQDAAKMAEIQGIHRPIYISKAKWIRTFFLQQIAWCSNQISLASKLRLSLWIWMDMLTRSLTHKEG